jgi:hypothetical protein
MLRSIRFLRPDVAVVFAGAHLQFKEGNETREMKTRGSTCNLLAEPQSHLTFENTKNPALARRDRGGRTRTALGSKYAVPRFGTRWPHFQQQRWPIVNACVRQFIRPKSCLAPEVLIFRRQENTCPHRMAAIPASRSAPLTASTVVVGHTGLECAAGVYSFTGTIRARQWATSLP